VTATTTRRSGRSCPAAPTAITLEFSPEDLLRCRFGISPVGEVFQATRALANPGTRAHTAWLRDHRPTLERLAHAHDLRPLFAVLPDPGYFPDFLMPSPSGPLGEIDTELTQIGTTPRERVRAEIAHCLESRGPIGDGVAALLRADDAGMRLADLLGALWDALIGPLWPEIRGVSNATCSIGRARSLSGVSPHSSQKCLHWSASTDDVSSWIWKFAPAARCPLAASGSCSSRRRSLPRSSTTNVDARANNRSRLTAQG
jgi:hypothetical protein